MAQTLKQGDRALRYKEGLRAIRFIEAFCVYPSGPKAGEPFKLMKWQKLYLLGLLEADLTTGIRKHRWSFLTASKKSSKTSLIAALALYFLVASTTSPKPQVIVAASTDDQADILFGDCRFMVENGPLKSLCDVYDKIIEVASRPGAFLKRVSSATGESLDGLRATELLFDELHTWTGAKHREVWNRLVGATADSEQPLVIQITTAGSLDTGNIYDEQETYARNVLNGKIEDDAYYAVFYEAPEGAKLLDAEALKSANPGYGVTVQPAFYADQVTKRERSEYLRYFHNLRQASLVGIWDTADVWPELIDEAAEFNPSLPLYVGLDLALRGDSSAVGVAQKLPSGKIHVAAKIWSNPYPRRHKLYGQWKLSLTEVENYLLGLFEGFPTPAAVVDDELRQGPLFGYDPHMAEAMAQRLEGEGLTMVEVPQNDTRMIPISVGFRDLCFSKALSHGNDADLNRHINSVVPHIKARGWRISKPKGSTQKIDAAVAIAIAAYYAKNTPNPGARPPKEEPGFVSPDED